MPDDPPRRRRRSSISEHIQRVFNVDRSDKNSAPGDRHSQDQTEPVGAPLRNGLHKSEATHGRETPTEQSVPDDTGPSSFTYSSLNSRIPSIGTPDSSPSVQPVVVKYEDTVPRSKPRMTSEDDPNAERDQICSSPTWHKDEHRKERRATKRLEAERKELEKRLLQLEEAQTRLEHGDYERNSRRLTKKQPLGSSNRSSSANTERPRSSSAFSAFFSSSRRSSRSRASSIHGADRNASRRGSSDLPNGPPTLPLVLPERFGAAVSRELATRHGTSLISSHQLQQHTLPKLHTTTKSDDLRENWKMAEAWKRKNDAQGIVVESLVSNPEIRVDGQPVNEKNYWGDGSRIHPPPSELSADLDRELFTASLKREHKTPGTARLPASASSSHGNPVLRSTIPSLRSSLQSESQQRGHSSAPARISANRPLSDFSLASTENAQNLYNSKGFQPAAPTLAISTGGLPKKTRMDPSSNAIPKIYKPSPLSLNPTSTRAPNQKDENRASNNSPGIYPKSLQSAQLQRFPQPYQYEEYRGRNRQSMSAYYPSETTKIRSNEVPDNPNRQSFHGPTDLSARNGNRQQENRYLRTGLYDNRSQKITEEVRQFSNVVPPMKHPGRKSPLAGNTSKDLNHENMPIATGEGTAGFLPESNDKPRYNLVDSVITSPARERTRPGHSRTPSGNSSPGASSYDTADEEVLDIPSAWNSGANNQEPEPKGGYSLLPSAEDSASKEPHDNPVNFRGNVPPPLAPGGPVNMLRRKTMQKTKIPKQEDVIAKLFVICCHCKYWHDMPSKVYAKLACPERLPSESLLARTFSGKRQNSLKNSIFSLDQNDHRRLSMPRRTPSNDTPNTQGTPIAAEPLSSTPSTQPQPLYRPQCCWCGHSMGKSCCQGWTAVVQLRERHH
ncbi:uncharacterized protein N7459_006133 [Penicillium hispanicum]|uniref:uncharacterized protein n=1 Tax=Penicillium hispanicum TaxID=1080232 RepID=UPI00254078CE|nr:uncharacterized protein N7459_006133 [Penicillium hispanicum]KAJ5580148.1 hypothetical protein N7459_006133 [Penicillium hispanicum]